jgi:cytochrome c2
MPDRQRPEKRRIALAGDKGYDVTELRARNVTPHIAVQGHKTKSGKTRKTAIDRRTTRHAGYRVSQKVRKRVEEIFAWTKSSVGAAKTKFRGVFQQPAGALSV